MEKEQREREEKERQQRQEIEKLEEEIREREREEEEKKQREEEARRQEEGEEHVTPVVSEKPESVSEIINTGGCGFSIVFIFFLVVVYVFCRRFECRF